MNRLDTEAELQCPTCHGSGEWRSSLVSMQCPLCGGAGTVHPTTLTVHPATPRLPNEYEAHLEREVARIAAERERLVDGLAELELHDNTGDPRDEGYMAALADVRELLSAVPPSSGLNGTASGCQEPWEASVADMRIAGVHEEEDFIDRLVQESGQEQGVVDEVVAAIAGMGYCLAPISSIDDASHRERLVSALRIADDALSAATRQNSDTWETTTAVATKALAIVRAALDPNAEARCAMSGCLLATPHHHVDTPDGEYVIRDPKAETPKEDHDAQ